MSYYDFFCYHLLELSVKRANVYVYGSFFFRVIIIVDTNGTTEVQKLLDRYAIEKSYSTLSVSTDKERKRGDTDNGSASDWSRHDSCTNSILFVE